MSDLTANSLKDALWDTLARVKDGDMLPSHADAVASQAREILRTVKVQLQIANQSKSPLPPSLRAFSEDAPTNVVAVEKRRAG